jgi:hypothetical protein
LIVLARLPAPTQSLGLAQSDRRHSDMKNVIGMSIAMFAVSLPVQAHESRSQRKKAPEKEYCIVLPGKSGHIEDRCKQISLQRSPEWHRRLCGPLIRSPVF